MKYPKCSIEVVCSFHMDCMSVFSSAPENGRSKQTTITNSEIEKVFEEGYSPALLLPEYCDKSEGIYDPYMGWRLETRDRRLSPTSATEQNAKA